MKGAPEIQLRQQLIAASRRLDLLAILHGAAAGAAAGVVALIALWLFAGGASLVVVILLAFSGVVAGAAAFLIASRRKRPALANVAAIVEARVPGGCRNLVVTAAELIGAGSDYDAAPESYVRKRILNSASVLLSGINERDLFPLRKASASLSGSAALLLAISALAIQRASAPPNLLATVLGGAGISDVSVTITPPAYTGRDPITLRNPLQLDVFSGSRIRVRARARAAAIDLETLAGALRLARQSDGMFEGDVVAETDGFIALQALGSDSSAGQRKLMGVRATPDRPPRVQITTPGRDVRVEDTRRSIAITTEASDDVGLLSLRLRYTKVSGSGEQFTFSEGNIALETEKPSALQWRGSATWNLESLGLNPGDMVVYRAEVRDTRPGAPAYESDSYIVEVPGPGALLAGGFSIDEEFDRYAVSQQMVILKTERLLVRRDSISDSAFADESLNLAAEQRKVRAEFIFMMGGELADEVTGDMAGLADLDEHSHAALDDEAISGRLAHEGRLDLIRAIRSMSHASSFLNGARADSALTHERAALASLQRAFARTRYILRTLTERERIDPARRLTGALETALRERGPVRSAAADSVLIDLRGVLASLATVAADTLQAATAQATSALSQRILRRSGTTGELRSVAAKIDSGGALLAAGGSTTRVREHLQNAVVALTVVLREFLASTPRGSGIAGSESKRLHGIVTDALRGVRR